MPVGEQSNEEGNLKFDVIMRMSEQVARHGFVELARQHGGTPDDYRVVTVRSNSIIKINQKNVIALDIIYASRLNDDVYSLVFYLGPPSAIEDGTPLKLN